MAQAEGGVPVLLVDDDATFRERLARAFEARGFDVTTAGNHSEALAAARAKAFARAVIDLRMPGESGLAVVADLAEIHPALQMVILTGYASIATAVQAVRLGAVNYLAKPANADQILAAFHPETPEERPADSETPSLAQVEWEHIHRVLSDCGGNISEAARRLGVHRRSLQRKLAKFPPS